MRQCIRLYGIEVLHMKKTTVLPRDLADRAFTQETMCAAAAKISVAAGRRAMVENHKGVLEYTAERILLSTGRGRISVQGTNLTIEAMNRSQMLITGRIQSVEWE